MTERSKTAKQLAWEQGVSWQKAGRYLRDMMWAPTPTMVQTSGVSCRMGVGGRQHRKRRRAEERKAGGRWVLYHPIVESKGDGFRVYEEMRKWADAMILGMVTGISREAYLYQENP